MIKSEVRNETEKRKQGREATNKQRNTIEYGKDVNGRQQTKKVTNKE